MLMVTILPGGMPMVVVLPAAIPILVRLTVATLAAIPQGPGIPMAARLATIKAVPAATLFSAALATTPLPTVRPMVPPPAVMPVETTPSSMVLRSSTLWMIHSQVTAPETRMTGRSSPGRPVRMPQR
jgi:hypothetical protein